MAPCGVTMFYITAVLLCNSGTSLLALHASTETAMLIQLTRQFVRALHDTSVGKSTQLTFHVNSK